MSELLSPLTSFRNLYGWIPIPGGEEGKRIAHYLIAAAIFILYGVQVCPFINDANRLDFVISTLLLFSLMYGLRLLILHYTSNIQTKQALQKQFLIDMGVFLLGGVILSISGLINDAPWASVLRIMLGMSMIGFLVSTQFMLKTENHLIVRLKAHTCSSHITMTSKIKLFSFFLLVFFAIVMIQVIYQDFEWMSEIGRSLSPEQAALWVLYEITAITLIFLFYTTQINHHFSKNIQTYFYYQNSALFLLQQGKRNVSVPILSNDEYAITAKLTNQMIDGLNQTEEQLKQTTHAAIMMISSLVETRDSETGAHLLRTQAYVKALAEELRKDYRFSHMLDDETLDLIYRSAPLHDLGKVGIPDAVLLKPGRLTDEEIAIMKQHPSIGKHTIERVEEAVGPLPFLRHAKEISAYHHEKWDGTGYPLGLKGYNIPLSARLMAIADVYDALISQRVYKPAYSHERAREMIIQKRGIHFDPDIVDAFLAIEDQIVEIAQRYREE